MPHGKRKGKHAMLFVGVRRLEGGTKRFLVQNWWAKKQFVEMDEKYIKTLGGIPFYVKKEQTAILSQFDTIFKSYAETTVDLEEVTYTSPNDLQNSHLRGSLYARQMGQIARALSDWL